MTTTAMEGIFKTMTVRTTFRAWFHPLDYFTEYDDGDSYSPYLCHDAMTVRDHEARAVREGAHLDYELVETDYEDHAIAVRKGERFDLNIWEPDAFYAIQVLKPGLEPAETLTLSDFVEVEADPKNNFVTIAHRAYDCNDVEQMMPVLKRWLQNRS